MKDFEVLDPSILIKLLKEQIAINEKYRLQTHEQNETIKALAHQLQQLQNRIAELLHKLYGTKSERRKPKLEDDGSKCNDNKQPTSGSGKKANTTNTRNGRGTFDESLPRIKVKHEIPEGEQFCQDCHSKTHIMGKVITEQLSFKPAEFFVKEHIRYKYKCNCCSNITTAPMPAQPIDKGLADASVLAETIINKYQDCLPLYRQQQRFARHGIQLPISTLCDWISESAFILQPIVDYMKDEAILKGKRIFTDDTSYPVQDRNKKGQTHTGRLWTYVGGGDKEPVCVAFEYTKTRSKNASKKFLKGFKGYLQADAYPGYDCLYETGKIIEVGCWAHARRPFAEIVKLTKKPGHADKALIFISELYKIEDKIKHLPPDKIKYYRGRFSKPILKKFRRWLKRVERKMLPKSPIGKAVSYLRNHWQALNNYLRDGTLKIDNNQAERSIRMIVIGRKNYMFAGSHEGAQRAAVIYSIIETCKMNGINTFEYLTDVLSKLPTTLNRDLHQLVPYNWVKSNPQ